MYARVSQIAISVALTTFASTCGQGTPSPPRQPARASGPVVGACAVFPSDNAWNADISKRPVSTNSARYIAEINGSGATSLHPDFGSNPSYGIPYLAVAQGTTRRQIRYAADGYGDESDPGPFPIPPSAPIEGGSSSTGDRHVLVVEKGACHLYELGRAFWRGDHWDADVGVNWDLSSNALRPLHWTSADAAGLPILPGLARYDEVAAGSVDHALRFTVSRTQRGFVLPATHFASSSTDPTRPPMGLRFRLKANYDLSRFHGASLVILRALKRYGMIVA
ncbi:MAG: hypothetical protein QOH10_1503, partial [Actinomycetota bacterium]|nr:hypothetical protein [Actinomycetota bacterium]